MSLSQRDPTWTLGMILWPWWWVREFHRQAQDLYARLNREMDKLRKTEELLVMEQVARGRLMRDAKVIGELIINRDRNFKSIFIHPINAANLEVREIYEPETAYDCRTRTFSTMILTVTMSSLEGIAELTREQAAANLHILLARHTDDLLSRLERDRFKDDARDGVEHRAMKDYHREVLYPSGEPPQMTLKNIGGETTS